jgi:hypothetical protein
MKIFSIASITALSVFLLSSNNVSFAQNTSDERPENSTAILDTAIPFAIGAREGEQSIRGAFGWPTFQEGFVEGVYFRFDPDGYARFSTSPRLDEDVFEVTCQNASTICIAEKSGLEINLTNQGQPQLRISGITPIDTFFISDRKNELPLPNTILGPIDQRLEALLSSGGDLIIRRELETLQTLSLSGFSATVTFLRWVAQNQASFIFPRGWPVPSQTTGQQNMGLTLPNSWVDNTNAAQLKRSPRSRQNQQAVVRKNQNTGTWVSNLTTNETQLAPLADSYELSAIGFAEQAHARSLPADVNRFEIASPQGSYAESNNSNNLRASNTARIEGEILLINQSIKNIEVMVGNIVTQLSHSSRSTNMRKLNETKPQVNIYKSLNDDAKNTSIPTSDLKERQSEEDKLRQLVIENLLQKSQQTDTANLSPPKLSAGEISVKKSIVERLLEELNGEVIEKQKTKEVTPADTGEFISLSDYISKIIQAEEQ